MRNGGGVANTRRHPRHNLPACGWDQFACDGCFREYDFFQGPSSLQEKLMSISWRRVVSPKSSIR